MEKIPSLAKQRAFVRSLDTERTNDAPKGIDNKEDNRNFEGMVTAEGVATSGIRGKLRVIQCVSEKSGEAVPTTILEVIELNREGIEIKRKNATSSGQITDM